MINKISAVIETLQAVPGTNDKLELLRVHKNLAGFQEVMQFIYDPYIKTGISEAKYQKAFRLAGSNDKSLHNQAPVSFTELMYYLQEHSTGSDADLFFVAKAILSNWAWRDLIKAIATKNLKIGITATSLNKVYGDSFIPRTGCMLGTLYDEALKTREGIKWPCIITEKLDGIRRILIKENGTVRMYSRSGHEDTGLVDIEREAYYLPDNHIYDGELLAAGEFKDSIALRQATNSIANKKGERTGVIFNIFDMLPVSEFKYGCRQKALYRKERLGAAFKDRSISTLTVNADRIIEDYAVDYQFQHIQAVPILGLVDSFAQVEPIVQEIWRGGGEGVMLNTANGLYEVKRSLSLIKVKNVLEITLPICGFLEGSGKYEGILGALLIDYKGISVGVGTGLTDWERLEIWQNKKHYLGKKVEIEYFGESTNMAGGISLNCPRFKRFAGEVE